MFTLVLKYGNKANIPMGLLEKFDRLSKHPELINSDTYNVRSKVSPEVLALFLARVCGTESTESVTEKNADELWDLCDELGFSGFDDELRTVLGDGSSVHRRDVIALRNLVDRQNVVLEELRRRQTALERQLQMQRDLPLQVIALRAEVQKLDVSGYLVGLICDFEQLKQEVREKACLTDPKVLCVEAEHCQRTKDGDEKPAQTAVNGKSPSVGNGISEIPGEKLNGIITQFSKAIGQGKAYTVVDIKTYGSDSNSWRWSSNVTSQVNNIFWSNYGQNAYIGYDFRVASVMPTSYSIKSSGFDQGGPHPRSWVIEVSNDESRWHVIDRQDNNNSLNNKWVVGNFQIKTLSSDKYRYIRLRQTGKNHAGDYDFTISSLEVFGFFYDFTSPRAKSLAYDHARPLDGIIADITRRCGGHTEISRVVGIISAFHGIHTPHVSEIGTDSIWMSSCQSNASIGYDFRLMRVTPTSYSIRTGRTVPSEDGCRLEGWHPKSWVFEVSNDEEAWDAVDHRNNNYDLNGIYVTHNFQISPQLKQSFRFVRIRMTGKNHAGTDGFAISSFEVFGTISTT